MKECRKCNTELIVGENTTYRSYDNKDFICKPCNSLRSKKRYQKDKSKWKHEDGTWKIGNQSRKAKRKSAITYHNKLQGVYGIFSNGDCLYVGESSKILKRFSDHKTYIKNPNTKSLSNKTKEMYIELQQYNHLIFGIIEECNDHKNKEAYWVNKYQPRYNIKYNV
jgi:hypothetical protein